MNRKTFKLSFPSSFIGNLNILRPPIKELGGDSCYPAYSKLSLFFLIFLLNLQLLAANSLYLKPRVILEKQVVKLSDIARLHKDLQDRVIFEKLDELKILSLEDVKSMLSDSSEITFYGKECILIPLNKKYTKEEIPAIALIDLCRL